MQWMIEERTLPDLLFLSNNLPELSGYSVTFQLKARFPALPIIMLLRHPNIREKLFARLSGANRYLTKPLRQHEIREVLESFLSVPLQG
jgi:DNA-binding response OmpR family regulator